VDNQILVKKNKEAEEEIKIVTVKSHQSVAESNIMLLPFVAIQNTNIKIFKRVWITNGVERALIVKGSADLGVPNIKDLDTLLALFKIMIKNKDYKYEYNPNTNTVEGFSNVINFTFKELAEEMGYKYYGGQVKNIIQKSLERLNETTIYSQMAFRDAEKGDYITEFDGKDSFRIIQDLKTYSYKKIKASGKKIGNAVEVKEQTSLKIHDFFFKNICNNYFKIYDYNRYLKLKLGIAKKLYLLLNQWSHGFEKYLTYKIMYDMLGLEITNEKDEEGNEIPNKKDIYYHNKQIKKAFNELKEIGFIQDFKEDKKKNGVNIIFNLRALKESKFIDKYLTDPEVVSKLRENGISYEEILKYYRLDNQDYVKGVLRLYDFKKQCNEVVDDKGFIMAGLIRENYDVESFI